MPPSVQGFFSVALTAAAIAVFAAGFFAGVLVVAARRRRPALEAGELRIFNPSPVAEACNFASVESLAAARAESARTFAEVEQLGTIVDQVVDELGEVTEVTEALGPHVASIVAWSSLSAPSLIEHLREKAGELAELRKALDDQAGKVTALAEWAREVRQSVNEAFVLDRRHAIAVGRKVQALEAKIAELEQIEPDPLERPFIGQHVLFTDPFGEVWPAVVVKSHMDTDRFPVDLFVFEPASGFAECVERGEAGETYSWRHVNGE